MIPELVIIFMFYKVTLFFQIFLFFVCEFPAENHSFGRQSNNISVCMATDDNYTQHAAVTIASILKNADPNDKIRIYILHKGLKEENIKKLNKLHSIRDFELIFRKLDISKLKNFRIVNNHLTIETWFRIFIPELCFDAGDKLLYMDVDMVAESSLKDLFATDMGDNYVAVVDDFTGVKPEYKKQVLHMNNNSRYFNAGMILFNLKKCLEDKIFDKAIDFWNKYHSVIKFEDQDVLNAVCFPKRLFIHPKFNMQNVTLRNLYDKKYSGIYDRNAVKEAIAHPVIIHFASVGKPWKFFANHPYRAEYYKYLQFTEWRDNTSKIADIRYSVVMFIKKIFFNFIDFFKSSNN